MTQLILTGASAVSSLGAGLAKTLATTGAAYAANLADRLIFGPRKRSVEGPRLETVQVQASTEGAPVLRVYGRARVAGQLIWATRFRETMSETTERSGKGGRLAATKTTVTEYLYSVSFAVGLCEGVIDRVARVWADGKPFDLSPHNVRVYRGAEDQLPDALIEAVEGEAPAFRGIAYIVFEDLPLADFGNRIPQLTFEIEKSLRETDEAALENAVRAVTMIPGSGEFVYGTTRVFREDGEGRSVAENAHNSGGETDFSASLDALLAACPSLEAVSLVVSWFGADLRAGSCAIRPGVEVAQKSTTPYEWRAGGATREAAHLVSTIDGAPAYGGTPADRAVVEAIGALKARGLAVTLHPFLLMDIAPGNALPDPHGGAEQAAYPWRGRIGVGAHDKTPAAAGDIAAFFGAAAPSDFSIVEGEVVYAGPAEWSFRRMILHMANLAALAGGVERFLLGSELRGLTCARSGAAEYPAVAALRALAADVKTILPAAQLSYGADWSEYFGHQPTDGSGDLFFHLDPLWADPNIAFVGVDNYMPLADWRDGHAHLDAQAGFAGQHDRDYLMANIEGGEGYDWFYADEAARAAQTRTPITDGAHGEPWVYRYKDIRSWWENEHYDRPGGVRSETPTAWAPRSKPVVFTEAGAPAVDKGANRPNVFLDAKSAESALPWFSSGARDDLAQRRAMEALLAYWGDPANNPVSDVYDGRMIETARTFLYAYDARPFPFFPALGEVWGDAANWERGHWLNGRLGRAPLSLLVGALCEEAGAAAQAGALSGTLTGYIVDRPMSAREAIDPLADIFQFDMAETQAGLRFSMRDGPPSLVLGESDLVRREGGPAEITTGEAGELPRAVRLGFLDETADYLPALVEARDPASEAEPALSVTAPIVIDAASAAARARSLLADAHVMRETARFALAPSLLAVEPGDVLYVTTEDVGRRWRVAELADAGERRVSAVRVAPAVYESLAGSLSFRPPAPAPAYAPPIFALVDAPRLDGAGQAEGAALFAAFADPWPGAVALYRETGAGPVLAATATARASLGRLEEALPPFAGSGRWLGASLRLRLAFGALDSAEEAALFAGANLLAVETPAGWELLQFRDALLGDDGVWTCSGLLRGQAGTEDCAMAGADAGARAVLLNAALAPAAIPLDLRGSALSVRAGPARDLPDAESFAAGERAFAARSLLPLSPVHLAAAPAPGGLSLSWIRRTREGGDDWQGEAPLAEAYERYVLRLYDGETLLRTETVDGPLSGAPPNRLYTHEEIEEDFGPGGLEGASAPAFEVAQVSDRVGEGIAARKGLG